MQHCITSFTRVPCGVLEAEVTFALAADDGRELADLAVAIRAASALLESIESLVFSCLATIVDMKR